ncbi:Alpha-L-fucosidase [compost metagenome]
MMTGDEAIEKLIILRGWNGNYLANVGPAADGSMPKEAIEAWKTMATWMKHSAESVFETTSGDFPEKSNQPVTRKGKDAYVHVFPNFHKTVEMDVNQSPKKAVLLRTGKSVPFVVESGKLKMNIESHDRTRMVDVVKLIW